MARSPDLPWLGRRACLQRSAGLALGLAAMVPAMAAPGETPAAPPDEVRQALSGDVRLRGQGRLRFFGLPVYDIRLWSPAPVPAQAFERLPLALEIAYARALVGRLIAERSLTEMRRAGPLPEATAQRWLAAMTQLFPDVAAGDRLTGVNQAGEAALFFHNGRRLGELREARFAALFFGIWLAPHTSEPGLRQQLLGAAA